MPAPSASVMTQKTKANFGQKLGPDADDYLNTLFSKVEAAWQQWQDSITWGSNTINGGGVGAWSGVGSGGMLSGGTSFELQPFVFRKDSPQQKKFTQGLAKTLKAKFGAFPATYKIGTVNYTGVSGASPTSPGPVSAQAVPAPLSTAGSGQNISGIAPLWKAELTPPDFDLNNPNGKGGDLVDAIAKAIEQCFQSVWLATTMIQGNMVQTTGTPGGVVAGFLSGNDGKLM